MKVETCLITPEIAKQWLEKNQKNRSLNHKRVSVYAEQMLLGNWVEHHQGIAFYKDGTLADGQHRLAAIVKSGIAIKMLVATGLTNQSGLIIDSHQTRQAHQSIKISGLADWIGKDEVAIARCLISTQSQKERHVSYNQIVEFCETHKIAIQYAMQSNGSRKKYTSSSTIRAAIACAYYYENQEKLSQFCLVFQSGMATSINDRPAILLREWLIRNSMSGGSERQNQIKRAMRAIKAFCNNDPIDKLYQPADFIYKLPEGFFGNEINKGEKE